MSVTLYNSRSKTKETLEDDKIGMYMCGPTVYDKVHVGNLRTFLFGDVVYRTLKYFGKKVDYVMNITDVDDKIIKKVENGKGLDGLVSLTTYYEKLFIESLKELHIQLPEFHKVTKNMHLVTKMIIELLDNECAYQTEDGSVYYDTSKNENLEKYFGIHLNNDDYEPERDIIKSEGLKNKNDFVLWKSFGSDKFNEKNIFWDGGSVLGKGRPGWHIECSAIASGYLENVTLHLGGEDLIFPHHTNEIAQAESANSSKTFGKYWMHVSHLNLKSKTGDEEKMSKSLGNVIYLQDLFRNYSSRIVRMYMNSKHYQRNFTFTFEELDCFIERIYDIYRTIARLQNFTKHNSTKPSTLPKNFVEELEKTITKKLLDNFQIGLAFEEWEKAATNIRNAKRISTKDCESILEIFRKVDQIFEIINWDVFEIDSDTIDLMKTRDNLRKEKRYEESDKIRKAIQKNYVFEDDVSGYILFRKTHSVVFADKISKQKTIEERRRNLK